MFTQKRTVTKVFAYQDKVQLQWSHPILKTKEPALKYVLEYGQGQFTNSVEQFKQIYKGKAHKCLVADLTPSTLYRFRVKAIRETPNEQTDTNQNLDGTSSPWSDIIGLMTLPNKNN